MMRFKHGFTGWMLALVLLLLPGAAMAQQAAPPNPAPQAAPVAQPATPAKAETPALKIGSVVQLRSGGPKMTIIGLSDGVVRAQWFNSSNNIFTTADFPSAAVKTVDDDEDEDDEDDDDEDEDDE